MADTLSRKIMIRWVGKTELMKVRKVRKWRRRWEEASRSEIISPIFVCSALSEPKWACDEIVSGRSSSPIHSEPNGCPSGRTRARGLRAELHLGLPRHDRKSLLYSKSQPQPVASGAGRRAGERAARTSQATVSESERERIIMMGWEYESRKEEEIP